MKFQYLNYIETKQKGEVIEKLNIIQRKIHGLIKSLRK